MKKIFTFLLLLSISLYSQIINEIPPIYSGPYPVASTDLTHDATLIGNVVAGGGSVGEYWEGRIEGKKYISQLLPQNTGAIKFDVEIPNDPSLYGEEAGKTYTYVAFLVYPTTDLNTRDNYVLPGNFVMPKMQKGNETPIFADLGKKLPLLIFSHGQNGHPIPYIQQLEYLASHGYAVVALFHADKRFKPFEAATMNEAQEIASRPLAASKLIDYLTSHDHYKDNIDLENVSAVGISYGGSTNLGLLGAEIVGIPSNRPLHSDNRVKCAVGIVPYVGGTFNGIEVPFFGTNNSGLKNVTNPYLSIAASADVVAPYDAVKKAMEDISGESYLVKLDGVGHELSTEALNDIFSWTLLFIGKYQLNDSLATLGFETTTGIIGGEPDSFIPLSVPSSPVLISPETDFEVTGSEITLNWNYKNDAGYYQIEISETENFAVKLKEEIAQEGIKFTYNNIENNKQYFWRVRGGNNVGDGEYSEIRRFYKGEVTSVNSSVPTEFSLSQNYPNPFNPETTIKFSIPDESEVIIEVYNILGQKVKTLVKNKFNGGYHQVNFNADGFSSGVYFYSMKSKNYFEIKKMIIVK